MKAPLNNVGGKNVVYVISMLSLMAFLLTFEICLLTERDIEAHSDIMVHFDI